MRSFIQIRAEMTGWESAGSDSRRGNRKRAASAAGSGLDSALSKTLSSPSRVQSRPSSLLSTTNSRPSLLNLSLSLIKREAVSSWNGKGCFLFTSSSAPYDCNDNGYCDEVLNLLQDRGAHVYWLQKGVVEARPDHILNLIHYEIDEITVKFDEHAPPVAKQVAVQVHYIAIKATRTTQVRGPSVAAYYAASVLISHLRRGEEHSFILKPSTSIMKSPKMPSNNRNSHLPLSKCGKQQPSVQLTFKSVKDKRTVSILLISCRNHKLCNSIK